MLTSVHLTYVLGILPFEERFPAARKLGFRAVEYPFPYDVPAEDYARLLRANGLEQITLGAPTSDYRSGMPGYSVTPALKSLFDQSISQAIDYAKTIDCSRVHVFAGARSPDIPLELALQTYCDNLTAAHDRLADAGLEIVIEPINSTDFPGYLLDTLAGARTAIQRSGRGGIKIVLDTYHAHANREDPAEFLRAASNSVSHIQLADFPGRHEPGTGIVDFTRIFRVLGDVGYAGSIGLEYIPTRSIFEGVPLSDLLHL